MTVRSHGPWSPGPLIEQTLAAAGLPPLPRLAWLEIDQDALANNLRVIRSMIPAGVEVAAVIKSDGYGHGLVGAARAFVDGGADRLCVSMLDEAVALRRAGIAAPIVILFSIPPSEVAAAAGAGFELVASDAGLVRALLAAWRGRRRGGEAGRTQEPELRLHLEIETGLGRAGVTPEVAPAVATEILATPGCRLVGLWSHLARPEDERFSAEQAARLSAAGEALTAAGIATPPQHLSATGGLFAATAAPLSMVRPGLCLYGELPADLPVAERARAAADALRPAMAIKARPLRIADIEAGTPVGYGGRWTSERRSRIATLPIGYGDGWARAYQPGAQALVRGRRVALVGSVAMDAIAADVTDVPEVSLADEFVLLGAQGSDRITAAELARQRTTIAWEVLAGMANRMPRVYHAGSGWASMRTLEGEILVGRDATILEPAQ